MVWPSKNQLAFLASLHRQGGVSQKHAHSYPDPYTDNLGNVHAFNTVTACKNKSWVKVERHGEQEVAGRLKTVFTIQLTPEGQAIVDEVLDVLGLKTTRLQGEEV